MKRLTWTLLRLVLQSKGYAMKEMASRLQDRWPKRKGLGSSSIQEKAKKGKRAPRDVASFITSDELQIRKGYEEPAKVVRLGLAAWRGEPSPAIGKRLDALGGKLDGNGGKLDAIQAILGEMRTELKSARHVTGTVVGLLLLLGLLFAGRQIQPDTGRAETTSATQLPPVGDAAKGATGRGVEAYLRAVLGAVLDLGKKAEENRIPKEPFPGQKLAKDCDAGLGEQPVNGGCWVYIYAVKPPCGKLFRHEDKCYRPVSADPTKPVGLVSGVTVQP